jgi:hypothetical protein
MKSLVVKRSIVIDGIISHPCTASGETGSTAARARATRADAARGTTRQCRGLSSKGREQLTQAQSRVITKNGKIFRLS